MNPFTFLLARFRRPALRPEHQHYAGFWQTSTGSFVEIFDNGLGNCVKLVRRGETRPAQLMNRATVRIEASALTLSRRGATVRFVVEQEPTVQQGHLGMVLDGILYTKVP